MKSYSLIATILVALFACAPENASDQTSSQNSSINLEFDLKFGSETFELNRSDMYAVSGLDSAKFSTFKFYISNVELTNTDNQFHKVPDSYYLVDASNPSSLDFKIEVPAGSYKKITFSIGVDSLRNVSGAQSGALDPLNDMFWTWNSGYIFSKLEGVNQKGHSLRYHIGGFKKSLNQDAVQILEFDQTMPLIEAKANANVQLHFMVDVKKWFTGAAFTPVLTSDTAVTMPGTKAVKFSQNYSEGFELHHIHN